MRLIIRTKLTLLILDISILKIIMLGRAKMETSRPYAKNFVLYSYTYKICNDLTP